MGCVQGVVTVFMLLLRREKKQLADFDTECQQMRGQLSKKEERILELESLVEKQNDQSLVKEVVYNLRQMVPSISEGPVLEELSTLGDQYIPGGTVEGQITSSDQRDKVQSVSTTAVRSTKERDSIATR